MSLTVLFGKFLIKSITNVSVAAMIIIILFVSVTVLVTVFHVQCLLQNTALLQNTELNSDI